MCHTHSQRSRLDPKAILSQKDLVTPQTPKKTEVYPNQTRRRYLNLHHLCASPPVAVAVAVAIVAAVLVAAGLASRTDEATPSVLGAAAPAVI